MDATRQTRWGLWALVSLQLLTCATAIVLLGRMGPAIGHILEENVYSTAAVEDMLAALARPAEGPAPVGGLPGATPAEAFSAALERAEGNITEDAERPLVAVLAEQGPLALDGVPLAEAAVVGALLELGAVNRASMVTADAAAQRLGLAGAWAMAIMGLLGFLASAGVWRRTEALLLAPTRELGRVLQEVRGGAVHRRCTEPAPGSPGADLNWLLDRHAHAPRPTEDPALRQALVGLLDAVYACPAVVGNADGSVISANVHALEAQVGTRALAVAVAAGTPPEGWRVRALPDGQWVAVQEPPED